MSFFISRSADNHFPLEGLVFIGISIIDPKLFFRILIRACIKTGIRHYRIIFKAQDRLSKTQAFLKSVNIYCHMYTGTAVAS